MCLFCGGDASERDHLRSCDGRQGRVEADEFHFDSDPIGRAPRPFPPELDVARARHNRDCGMARADATASAGFRAQLDAAIYRAARAHEELICDAIYEFLPASAARGNLHSVGSAMRRAVTAGWLAPTNKLAHSAQVHCHRNPRMVWRSLIYTNGQEHE